VTDAQLSSMAHRVAATRCAELYGFDDRSISRIAHLLQHFCGFAAHQPAPAKAQLEALDDALNAVNAAWWEVVHNPDAFSALVGHYCDEASNRGECLERLRAALDLEPVRFAVRLARRHPWSDKGEGSSRPLGIAEQSRDATRLAKRLYSFTRHLPGPLKTDRERHAIVRELLEIVDIHLDPSGMEELDSAS
jgi:hypothetical protein